LANSHQDVFQVPKVSLMSTTFARAQERNMIGLFDLSPIERAQRYRELAKEVSSQANESTDRAARQSYMLVAEQWRQRADAVEKSALTCVRFQVRLAK
jgi:hypothetical protein